MRRALVYSCLDNNRLVSSSSPPSPTTPKIRRCEINGLKNSWRVISRSFDRPYQCIFAARVDDGGWWDRRNRYARLLKRQSSMYRRTKTFLPLMRRNPRLKLPTSPAPGRPVP
jgi:hypothetical protein